MKFTDLFVERPVLSAVVSLLILVLGLRSISSSRLRSIRQRECDHHRQYRVLRCRRCYRRGLYHPAPGAGDLPGAGNRLPVFLE